MRKMFFLMLTLIVLGAASMNAQVTIGSDKVPHSGAVLDLQSDNLGLKLPNVALDNDLTVFKLPITAPSTKEDAKGMYIYNTNSTIGEGVYVWDGGQWIPVKESVGKKPVESITITSDPSSSMILRGNVVQLTADITPSDATNPKIEWSVDRGTGNASLNETGLLLANYPGTFSVQARTTNGLSASMNFWCMPTENMTDMTKIGDHFYATYTFNGVIWMLENSKEGTSTYQMYDGDNTKVAYYYTRDQARSKIDGINPCPGDWHLPTHADIDNLSNYLFSKNASDIELGLFIDAGNRQGYYRFYLGKDEWGGWLSNNYFWCDAPSNTVMRATIGGGITYGTMQGSNHALAVRCVHN